jgi:hypothetical protein
VKPRPATRTYAFDTHAHVVYLTLAENLKLSSLMILGFAGVCVSTMNIFIGKK